MSLQSLLDDNKIEKIGVYPKAIQDKIDKAYSFLNYAKKVATYEGENEPIYTNVYDAIRIGCEAILLFYGYRVKASSEARHRTVIEAARDLMGEELSNEFQRMQKMRKKRNRLEYGNLTSISKEELKQSLEDAKLLLSKADELMKTIKPTLAL